jgi:lipopolysaccharide transport system ATP-binding protein
MADVVLEVDHVFKKFQRGEIYDSLRDLLPALTRALLRRRGQGRLERREFWALEDVSFQVRKGQPTSSAPMAPASIMLKLLSGIMRPTKGAARRQQLSALIE